MHCAELCVNGAALCVVEEKAAALRKMEKMEAGAVRFHALQDGVDIWGNLSILVQNFVGVYDALVLFVRERANELCLAGAAAVLTGMVERIGEAEPGKFRLHGKDADFAEIAQIGANCTRLAKGLPPQCQRRDDIVEGGTRGFDDGIDDGSQPRCEGDGLEVDRYNVQAVSQLRREGDGRTGFAHGDAVVWGGIQADIAFGVEIFDPCHTLTLMCSRGSELGQFFCFCGGTRSPMPPAILRIACG